MSTEILGLEREELARMVRNLPDDKVATALGVIRNLCKPDEIAGLEPLEKMRDSATFLAGKIPLENFLERKRAGRLPDCISRTYGMHSGGRAYVDEFLERKRADKELEL